MPQKQMTFAEIGTLYNSIANELEGGVTPQNQSLLLSQVSNVQTQLQHLINSGALNTLDGVGNPAVSLVHAQNIADQMNFLKTEIGAFGTDGFVPKFINDVVRDVQDIVASDTGLTALAHQGNHAGFQQVSFLLTNPTPFPDSVGDDVFSADGQHVVSAGADGVLSQTGRLLNFIDDSNSLAARAQALAGHTADGPDSANIAKLVADITTFTDAADAYSAAQGGLFSARFNNEFTLHGVQGTASSELIKGLQTGNADLVNGAAEVLMANAVDVRSNMLANGLTADGQQFVPAPNGGIPTFIDTVHDAGLVFDDAMTKLLGGVYSGNQTSIVNDLNATKTGLQNTITDQGLTGHALHDIQHVISLLDQESSLVSGINTASPTPISSVNGQIGQIQAQILNIVNHDATLAAMAVGADGTTGFVALPPGTPANHGGNNFGVASGGAPGTDHSNAAIDHSVSGSDGQNHIDVASTAHNLAHMWG